MSQRILTSKILESLYDKGVILASSIEQRYINVMDSDIRTRVEDDIKQESQSI